MQNDLRSLLRPLKPCLLLLPSLLHSVSMPPFCSTIKDIWQNTEAWRRSKRHGDGFIGLGDSFAYQAAPEVILRGSWQLYVPSLAQCQPGLIGQKQMVSGFPLDRNKLLCISEYVLKILQFHFTSSMKHYKSGVTMIFSFLIIFIIRRVSLAQFYLIPLSFQSIAMLHL